jgi:hypothetical protein
VDLLVSADPELVAFDEALAALEQFYSRKAQVGSVAFGRYDQFPQPLIALLLPTFEPLGDLSRLAVSIESDSLGIDLVSGARTGDVAPMGSLLSGNGVLRVDHPDWVQVRVRFGPVPVPPDRRFPLPLVRV